MLGKPVRDDSGAIVESGQAVVTDIQVGDCFNAVGAVDEYGGEIETVPMVPCSEAHDFEAYHEFQLEDGNGFYPGDSEVATAADQGCYDGYEAFVGVPLEKSELGFSSMSPTAGSWVDFEDRRVLCIVSGDERVTGSLEGSAR